MVADEIGLTRRAPPPSRALWRVGPIRDIRVGRANGRRFVMMAGAGFDANVVAGVSLALKKKLGPLAYVWQAAVQGVHANPSPVAPHDRWRRAPHQRFGGRLQRPALALAGPFVAAPDASLADDRFHVILMKGRGWFCGLALWARADGGAGGVLVGCEP